VPCLRIKVCAFKQHGGKVPVPEIISDVGLLIHDRQFQVVRRVRRGPEFDFCE
jgi:hypothetical protein